MKYVALLRGINVGGKNRLKMAELRAHLEDLGLNDVVTYIQSGNVIFSANKSADKIADLIEESLPKKFKLDSKLIKVLVLSAKEFKTILDRAPKQFGAEPDKYYYDFIFLKGLDSQEALKEFNPHPEVDTAWPGPGVIYHRRLGAKRTSSRLSRIVGKPVYKNMTIRSWTTTDKLQQLLKSG